MFFQARTVADYTYTDKTNRGLAWWTIDLLQSDHIHSGYGCITTHHIGNLQRVSPGFGCVIMSYHHAPEILSPLWYTAALLMLQAMCSCHTHTQLKDTHDDVALLTNFDPRSPSRHYYTCGFQRHPGEKKVRCYAASGR